MGDSKKVKQVFQKEKPKDRYVGQKENPDSYYQHYPAWNFNSCDTEMWSFTEENVGNIFWKEILPFLQALEKRTWHDILVVDKKKNHSIDVHSLNKKAQNRLIEKYIEQESIISLRITGKHRIYGHISGRVFNILWYDSEHGDNTICVCRSHKKRT